MREAALKPANLGPDMDVVDVGGGTGFCTIGILEAGATPKQVTMMDQSPHQLSKARKKDALRDVTIIEGDAEDLPFETDSKDRYVSAGSIEYWPEPQRGICESYRILKPGGQACMIGSDLRPAPPSRQRPGRASLPGGKKARDRTVRLRLGMWTHGGRFAGLCIPRGRPRASSRTRGCCSQQRPSTSSGSRRQGSRT